MNLQTAILELAPRFVARSRVPILAYASHPSGIARDACGLIVWDGASDATIYRDARVNHAFRAWHDMCHIKGNFGFTLDGESAACEMQIRELLERYPSAPSSVLSLIRAEVVGQAEYFAEFGEFPVDQETFIREYIG